ncbi:MAG: hypothetical protein M3R63_20695 [Actinomycetota bacterium]|nr:hypothetical protein [Actinomycetota bacterium]
MTETTDNAAAAVFLRSLRIATTVIAGGVLLGLDLPRLLAHLQQFQPPIMQIGGYLFFVAIVAIDVVLVVRHRSWGQWCWPAAALVLVAETIMWLSLPLGNPWDSGETAYGTVGWLGLLLLFDRPLRILLIFISVHVLLSAVLLLGNDVLDRHSILTFGLVTVGVCAFQLAVGGATVALRRVAATAITAARKEEAIRTQESVTARLHLDRQQRYEELAETARPLLGGLADGSLDPTDQATRLRCTIEAARMRRLFAESDDAEDPLLHELQAGIDVAERKGIAVILATSGRWPALPRELRRALTDAPLSALAAAVSTARVTVVGTPSAVSVSVVADTAALDTPPQPTPENIQVTTVQNETERWVQAQWTLNQN